MSRSTVENTIERIRRQLASTVRMEINTLGSNVNTSAVTFPLTYDLANSVRSGGVLSIGTELMRVVSVNRVSKEVTVLRGWLDTNAEEHLSGDEVLINPRFTRSDIYDGIIQEIDSWAPDIFTTEDQLVTLAVDDQGFEVDSAHSNALGVIEVRRNYTEQESVVWPSIDFRLHRGASASITPNEGTGLFVRLLPANGGGRIRLSGSALARYAIPYDSAAITGEGTDLVTDVGIDAPLLELIEMGVKARLVMDDETPRGGRGIQDEPRRAEEVPPGSTAQLAQTMLQRYERRRSQEVIRLRTKYPFKAW